MNTTRALTGATAGIGEAMAKSFARLGAAVHLLGRNPLKVKRSAGIVRGEVPGAVRAWTEDLSGRIEALHGLVHNAGAMPKERAETPQGHETQLACHVLGPHLITERLLPLLNAADGSSVVFMSSGGMYSAPLRVDDLESVAGDYDGVRVYARTKRMQVVLAEAWATRLAGTDIRVESMHPGRVDPGHTATHDVRVATRRGSRCRRPVPRPDHRHDRH